MLFVKFSPWGARKNFGGVARKGNPRNRLYHTGTSLSPVGPLEA
jgi:hypothetical protein